MAGEKRFRGSFFGFKKSDVNSYIEKILKEFDNKLNEKDEELAAIKIQYKDFKIKYEELLQSAQRAQADKDKIAYALIAAREKAESIIAEARNEAINEKKTLENQVENEKEKLVDLRSELKVLKAEVINTLKKYEGQLEGMASWENEGQIIEK
jgi:cell division initiation protein